MTDREAFLARWSRRKREAATTRAEPVPEQPAAPAAGSENSEPASAPVVPPSAPGSEPQLPPIESIGSGTDIRGFLQEGVPQDLARGALRRAWSSDPAIRDFIGLSENAWDFTAPEGVPGFGPFAPDAARQLAAQMLGGTAPASGAEPSVTGGAASDQPASRGEAEHEPVKAGDSGSTEAQTRGVRSPAEPEPRREDAAMQQQAAGPALPPGRSG